MQTKLTMVMPGGELTVCTAIEHNTEVIPTEATNELIPALSRNSFEHFQSKDVQ